MFGLSLFPWELKVMKKNNIDLSLPELIKNARIPVKCIFVIDLK
jgi:hypothetical protein